MAHRVCGVHIALDPPPLGSDGGRLDIDTVYGGV